MGLNPTEVFIQATVSPPNELGQPTFIEIILVRDKITTTFINQDGLQPCPQTCNQVRDFGINRDAFDPSTVEFARDLILRKGVTDLDNFRVFLRDFRTQNLSEITMTTQVKTKDSVVFVERSALVPQSPFTDSCGSESGPISRLKRRLANSQEILPSRFVWP